MKKTEQKVLKFIYDKDLIADNDKLLLALSGGPDSVFLLHLLLKFRRRFKIKIGAVHVNHMIRGKDAYDDEMFCSRLCLSLGIEFFSVRKKVKQFALKNKISVEEAGRIIRYGEFEKISRKLDYNKIATAHNCSDNAETLLLNLVKGAGLKGISGIPARRANIIRPILNISKEEILNYLKQNRIDFCTDSTNFSSDYERNFLRNKIIPLLKENLNPNLEKILFNSSEIFAESSAFMEKAAADIKEGLFSFSDGNLRISLDGLKNRDSAILTFTLKSAVERNFFVQTEFNDIKKIVSLQNKQTGRIAELSNKLSAVKERKEILIRKIKTESPIDPLFIKVGESVEIDGKKLSIKNYKGKISKFSGTREKEFISADNLSEKFLLRRWKHGERFYPIGLRGSKKISDFLNEQKIPAAEKKNRLVLINENKIVWVLGLRLDERFKITNHTKRIFELCLK